MEDYPRDLAEFEAWFATEEACRDYLFRLRWPEGFRCPRCEHARAWPVRKLWLQCASCGRQTERKALIAVAVEEKGVGMGRIRMRRVRDASAASLVPFVEESVEPGSTVHTDGWPGYEPLTKKGYQHRIVFLSGRRKQASELLPRVHKAISLLKRWLLGTHQGAISHQHLDYYLDEFVFRFNRRSSRSRGKLFYRLVQQAVAVEPTPYRSIVADWDAETL